MRVWTLKIVLMAAALVGDIGYSSAQAPSKAPSQHSSPENAPALASGANSFAERQARTLLQAKGYSSISPLVNGSDGIWRGSASKDGKKVDVSIDFQGHVAAR